MNLNPFAVQAPETVESVLDNAGATCARFNNGKGLFVGHYLALGRADGVTAVCCVETKDVIRWLEGHVKGVTSVSWSPYNRYLATSSLDWNVIIWDLGSGAGERARTLRFDSAVRSVQFSPASSKSLVVVLETQQAILIHLRKSREHHVNGHTNGASTSQAGKARVEEARYELGGSLNEDGDVACPPILSAVFAPDGKCIAVGTSKGDVILFDRKTRQVVQQIRTGSSGVKELAFDRSGRTLATNSNDRIVRLFTVTTKKEEDGSEGVTISPQHRFQDLVNRTPWLGIGFSADGEYAFGGASHKVAHNIYIWDRGAGVLDKILQGPRDSLIDCDWHPARPMLASVSNTGALYLWYNPPTETWSAYAPGFEELEENIVYEEREDEFDLEDEEELTRRKQDEEEAFVEIRPLPKKFDKSSAKADDGDDDSDDDDDDCDENFIIPVRLELDLPDLESGE